MWTFQQESSMTNQRHSVIVFFIEEKENRKQKKSFHLQPKFMRLYFFSVCIFVHVWADSPEEWRGHLGSKQSTCWWYSPVGTFQMFFTEKKGLFQHSSTKKHQTNTATISPLSRRRTCAGTAAQLSLKSSQLVFNLISKVSDERRGISAQVYETFACCSAFGG